TPYPTQSFTLRPVSDSNAGAAQISRPHASVLKTRSGVASSTSRSPIVGANDGGPWRVNRLRSLISPRWLWPPAVDLEVRACAAPRALQAVVSTLPTGRLSAVRASGSRTVPPLMVTTTLPPPEP